MQPQRFTLAAGEMEWAVNKVKAENRTLEMDVERISVNLTDEVE